MNNKQKVFVVKFIHSIIYFFMVSCMGYIFYCAIARRYDWALLLALAAIFVEVLVLMINLGTCPFTPLAEKYGSEHGAVTGLFLPNWCARNTFRISTVVVIIELTWLAVGYFTR
jgi:hypothetical protein